MPANLPPPYKNAEQRFREAKSTEDKMAALEEMMAIIPKHKGTDKLRANLRRQYSRLKAEAEHPGKKGKKGISYHIPKGESPQVVLVGTPNVGKSQFVAQTTNATPEVADYPFSTRLPMPAMMPFRDIYIELIDVPPLSRDHIDTWLPETIRNADAALLVIDLSRDDCVDSFMFVREALASKGIRLSRTFDPSETELPRNVKPTIIVANKTDRPEAAENLAFFREIAGEPLPIVPISSETGDGIDELKETLYALLDIVRVYSKIPGKDPDMNKPFIVKRGSSVQDVAHKIHREFADKLKFARVWGSGKFDGQVVERDHVVEDGDILEVHVDM
jgi:ribosome-interacting GTPase 1